MKKLLAILLALCMVFTLAACGSKEQARAYFEAQLPKLNYWQPHE